MLLQGVLNVIKSGQRVGARGLCLHPHFGGTCKSSRILLQGVRNLIKAGQEAGIQKIVLVSSFGVGCFPLNLFIGVSPSFFPAHASKDACSFSG